MTTQASIIAPANLAALKWLVRVAYRVPWRPSLDDVAALRGHDNTSLVDLALQELLSGTDYSSDADVAGVRQMMGVALASPFGCSEPAADVLRDHAWANVIGQQKARAQQATAEAAKLSDLLQRCLNCFGDGRLPGPKLIHEVRDALRVS